MATQTNLPDDFVLVLDEPVEAMQDDFELGPVIPDPTERNIIERNITDPFMRGLDSAGMAAQAGRLLAGGMSVGDFMAALDQHEFNQQVNPAHPDDVALMEQIGGTADWGQAAQLLFSNPHLIPQLVSQSLPASVPSIVGGTAGGIVGGAAGPVGAAVGGAAGAGAASGATEFMMSVKDALLENPAIASEAELGTLLQNDEFMGRVYDHAMKRGLAVGAFDAISFGLAGRVFRPVEQAAGRVVAPTVSRGAGAAAEVGTQAVTGAGGEAAAQLATEGEIARPGEVLAEGVAELGTGAPEIGAAVLSRQGAAQPGQGPALPDDFVLTPNVAQDTPNVAQDTPNVISVMGTQPTPVQEPEPVPVQRSTDPVQPAVVPPVVQPAAQVTAQAAPTVGQDDPGIEIEVEAQPAPATQAPAAPVPAANPAAGTPTPRREKVVTPDRELELEVEWEVIDADQLKSAEGQDQPRDRMRQGSDEQITANAARLDPFGLMGSRETDRGAPIIDDDNVILSGNGRVQSIMLAAEKHPERYQAYLASLQAEGFDTSGVKTPVLVRRSRNLAPENRRKFVTSSNSQGSMALAPSEQARVDRDYISDEMLAGFDPDVQGGVSAASNSNFVRDFFRRMPANDAAGLKNADGGLSPTGALRLQNAIFARAYDDQRLIERATESDEDVSIRNALLGAAGAWANMRNKAPKWDITSDLVAALDLIKTARDAGQSVPDYLNQIDAFADPVPDKVQQIARLFLSPNGSRLAAGKDMRARLTEYAKTATDDSRADGDLLGGRPGPDEVLAKMVEGVARSTDKSGEPAQLFAAPPATGPKRGRGKAPGQKAAAGPMLDAVGVPDAADDAVDAARKPQGTLAPRTVDVSYTNRQSVFEEAWRAAGFTPDEGTLLSPERKREVLRKLLVDTFGFQSVVLDAPGLKAKTPEAVNQMLDAYRNVRFLMHVLALPVKGVSLNGTLTLQLERDAGRYFGVYRPDARSIGLPGRSNSFAHEWAHALDHYLMDALQKTGKLGQLLSQAARSDGLDIANSLEEAFAKLVNAMFFDEAALAARVFELEQQADAVHKDGPKKGQPTKAALEAQAQIERIAKGSTRLRLKPSEYRKNSADFQPGGNYFPSVHEMLARAFEAYAAHKLESAGGSNEFVTKGEAAYLSDADARLAMTFPKGDDRLRIFAALDEVFDHLRVQQVLGKEPAAGRPDDVDILDPQHWNKLALDLGEPGMFGRMKREFFAFRNRARSLFSPDAFKRDVSQIALNAGINRKALPQRVIDRALDTLRYLTFTARGYMNARISRNAGKGAEFMSFIWDRFAAQPGSETTHIGATFEDERERQALKIANEVESLLKANGGRSGLSKAEADTVRDLMYGAPVKNTDKQLVAIAAGLRRIMERVYADGTAAGIKMGYIENKGYLPRVLLTDKVHQDPTGFERDAVKVYELVYDNLTDDIDPADMIRLANGTARRRDPLGDRQLYKQEIAALRRAMKASEAAQAALAADPSKIDEAQEAAENVGEALSDLVGVVRDDFTAVSAEAWRTAVVAGDSATYDAHGPAADFTKARTLPPEADEIMAAWHETDPLNLVVDYTHKVTSRAAYVKRAGQSNGPSDLNDVIRRADVKAAIRARPGKYDPDTPAGRLAILRDLANPAKDNILEMSIKEAERAGAYGPDVRELRGLIEDFSGRRTRGPLADILQRVAGVAYTFTYIALLSRASITALTEPLTVMLRTGDLKVSLQTFGVYLTEAVRTAKTVQQRAAIARAIGLTTTPLHDVLLLNRLEADSAQMMRGNGLMARFFRANFLAQLTNAQRRAAMTGGFLWMQSMAQEYAATQNGARKKIIEAELRELGIPTENQRDFMQWLRQHDGLPDLGDLDSKAGALFSTAVARFVDQVIQNPRRADKPVLTGNPVGAVVYSLTSFLYTFFSNVHGRLATRVQRDARIYQDEGFGKAEAYGMAGVDAAWTFASGFTLIYAGQLVVTMAREAIFNSEQWEKKRAAGELEGWITGLALSRTGIFGPGDIVANAMTGLRYERDLANLFVGPGPSYVASNLSNIARGLGWTGRNSPNTNTAEREAWKSAYRLFVAPLATGALSALDVAGPFGQGARYGALTYLSSNSAASSFADVFAGKQQE